MKFTLKDYQEDAVEAVLDRLRKARRRWHDDSDRNAFSLTAPTGAGKTVMAAAVIEALFFGNGEYEVEADPGAVVIWFSDDPSLNEQSRWRLQEASDKLTVSDLVTVENTFGAAKFEPGKVYFLNTQKLSKNSILVRGDDAGDPVLEAPDGQRIMPDLRSHTIWDTIRNTIEDPALTLYLVLDEAHRGMREGGRTTSDGKQTIVRRLINGAGGKPGIPVVWGISATVQRFNEAIAGMEGRGTLPNVVVDAKKVQGSGLLKDTINLDIPSDAGPVSTVLLRRATVKFRDISEAWADYARQQNAAEAVLPLMVMQVPNTPDHTEVGQWLDTIFEEWPELPSDSVANVLGEHRTEKFGRHDVPYLAPERIQESRWVRVLVAKDAISTGWDCPRAEVMVSFRAATDQTHITQLLGRMVRTPLARRIPGNDRLNAVDCLLPRFDKRSVEAVIKQLTTGAEPGEDPPERRILINPVELKPNPAITEDVWQKLLSLPSRALPRRKARPVKRLTALAHELAADGLLPDAGKLAHAELHKVLDGARERYRVEIDAARTSVMEVRGETGTADLRTGAMTFDGFVEAADLAVIDDAYRRAARALDADVTRFYCDHLVRKLTTDDETEALMQARTIVAALGLVLDIKGYLETEANTLAERWLTKYRVDIRGLTDERQDAYREIKQMSADPVSIYLTRPNSWLQNTTERRPDGTEVALPTFQNHLLCDEAGRFPGDFNDWERTVLSQELGRATTVAWYRNPARPSQDSLGIDYESGGRVKILRPDFVFFVRLADGTVAADIVDPHGIQFEDALPKLKGLARYAEQNEGAFRRIEVFGKVGSENRVIDLTEKRVRDAVMEAESADDLYRGDAAIDYTV